MKRRQPIYTNGEEPLTPEEAKAILISRGYDPDAVGKRMNTVAQQALKIVELEATNADLLRAMETIAKHDGSDNFVAKHLVAIANEAIRKAKSHADTLKGE